MLTYVCNDYLRNTVNGQIHKSRAEQGAQRGGYGVRKISSKSQIVCVGGGVAKKSRRVGISSMTGWMVLYTCVLDSLQCIHSTGWGFHFQVKYIITEHLQVLHN